MQELQDVINYQFADIGLLREAVTHRSYTRKSNYERLEFLGDSVLQMAVSEYLFHKFPQEKEGVLAKIRSSIVCGESLAKVAREMGLGRYILLNKNEESNGGRDKLSILEDVTEAIIGAVYLDSNYIMAEKFVLALMKSRLENSDEIVTDAKSTLQEWTHKQKFPMPEYSLEKTEGEEHKATFFVKIVVVGIGEAVGTGISKKKAQRNAAENFIVEYKVGG